MQLGRHVIEVAPKTIELNEAELKELASTGGQAWFMEVTEVKKAAKKTQKRIG